MKKKRMDFVTEGTYKRVKFRFYPKSSHMHGFGEEPPKDLRSVYKVYYSWSVFESDRVILFPAGAGPETWGNYKMVFFMPWDECSCIAEGLPAALRSVLDYENPEERAYSFGQPASEWRIWCIHGTEILEDDLEEVSVPEKDWFIFEVFDNFTDKGYRFSMEREDAERFYEYLNSINSHMLENGEPI